MAKGSFKLFVEQELGPVPRFMIYAVLEWLLIIVLFIDGFLSFFAYEFARFFELKIPCLLCTRIDHVFHPTSPDFYYNESICEVHKKDVSSLAYCHVHKELSDIRQMCEGCLLSFATGKESDCDTYKSLVGILHKDIELFVDEDQELHLSLPAGKKDEPGVVEKSSDYRCSCCGEPLKMKSSYGKAKNPAVVSSVPCPSPRASFLSLKNEDRGLDLHPSKNSEPKLVPDESKPSEDGDGSNTVKQSKEGEKAFPIPLALDEGDEDKTPIFGRNKFFGIPLSDTGAPSPRWPGRPLSFRKSQLDRSESALETSEVPDSALHQFNRQVRLDRKSLMSLYMELDEERNASAIAANNAMAMITRLQAEKAAVQMEALQYQRMMEEQAEYDQEALQEMNTLLSKREEEIKELEVELEEYRSKYGLLEEDDSGMPGAEDGVEGHREFDPPPSYSPSDGLTQGSENEEKPQNHEQCGSVQKEELGGDAATAELQKSSQAEKVGGDATNEKSSQDDKAQQLSQPTTDQDEKKEAELSGGWGSFFAFKK